MSFKKPIFLFIILLTSLISTAQNKIDTLYSYLDWKWKPITSGTPSYGRILWPEDGKWQCIDYFYTSRQVQMRGCYLEKECKIRDGVFTWYHSNGMMEDSCFYIKGKKQGIQQTWDFEGNQTSFQKWRDGLPVDTAIWFGNGGNINAFQITDSNGNGMYKQYLKDGKSIKINGVKVAGKRNGKWLFNDDNGIKAMEIIYDADSAIVTQCFNEKGEPEPASKTCIYEKSAQYKGGIEGWKKFLEKNLNYPSKAVKKEIQGVVRVEFNIDKEGNVSDVHSLNNPGEMLVEEAERIIRQSGKWEPAIQYNRRVIYRHIQSITFALQ
jgi:TonB family protein